MSRWVVLQHWVTLTTVAFIISKGLHFPPQAVQKCMPRVSHPDTAASFEPVWYRRHTQHNTNLPLCSHVNKPMGLQASGPDRCRHRTPRLESARPLTPCGTPGMATTSTNVRICIPSWTRAIPAWTCSSTPCVSCFCGVAGSSGFSRRSPSRSQGLSRIAWLSNLALQQRSTSFLPAYVTARCGRRRSV